MGGGEGARYPHLELAHGEERVDETEEIAGNAKEVEFLEEQAVVHRIEGLGDV